MAYSTSNPPVLLVNAGGNSPQHWAYKSSDALTAVDDANYFSNGKNLGMRVYDIVTVITTHATASSRTHSVRIVKSVSSSGPASLSTQAVA